VEFLYVTVLPLLDADVFLVTEGRGCSDVDCPSAFWVERRLMAIDEVKEVSIRIKNTATITDVIHLARLDLFWLVYMMRSISWLLIRLF
jgi:hypothetical protein